MTLRNLVFGLAAVALALTSGACSDDADTGTSDTGQVDKDAIGSDSDAADPDAGPGEAVRVETIVQATTLTAGAELLVRCQALDAQDREVTVPGTFQTSDISNLLGDSFVLDLGAEGEPPYELSYKFLTKAGTADVACVLDDPALVDDTPVTITVVPGPAAATAATVDPAQSAAGEVAAVTCAAEDEYGNATDDEATVVATPADEVAVDGASVSSTVAGTYELRCAVDGVDEAEQVAASWEVVPAAPVTFELALAPESKAYFLNQPVTVTGRGEDEYGNVLEDMPVTGLAADPSGDETVFDEVKIRFGVEGKYTVSATSVDYPDLTASAPLVVDQTPPQIVVTSPARGLIVDTTPTEVTVEGTVTDNLGEVAWLEVAGEPVAVAPDSGAFSVVLPLGYALNTIVVRAADPYDLVAESGRSVEWDDAWYAMDSPTVASDGVNDGLVVLLGQEIVDDGDQTEASADDLASVFALVLGGFDIGGAIPNPLVEFPCLGGDCTVTMDSFTFDDPPGVSLQLINGGIHVTLTLTNVAATIAMNAPCDFILCPSDPVSLPGTMTIDELVLETDVMLSLDAGAAVAEATNTTVDATGFGVTFNDPTGGLLQGVIDSAVGFVEPAILGGMELILPGLIEGFISDALGEVFNALKLDEQFELPAFVEGAAPNVLALKTELSALDVTPARMRLGMKMLAHAVTQVPPYDSPGSLKYTGCGPEGALDQTASPLTIGIHDDVVNQLLYGIWEGGTLSVDAGPDDTLAFDLSQYGIVMEKLAIDPLLPLAFDSCGKDEDHLAIGDLYIDMSMTFAGQPMSLKLWLQADATVTVEPTVSPEGVTKLGFVIGEFDPIIIDIEENLGTFEGDDAAVVGLFKDTLLPLLFSQVADLAFEIPTIDLSSLSDSIPPGTVLTPDIQVMGRTGAWLTAEGGLK